MLCLPQGGVAIEEVHIAVDITVPSPIRLGMLPLGASCCRYDGSVSALGLMPLLHPSVALALLPAVSPFTRLSSAVRAQVPFSALVSLLLWLAVPASPLGRDRCFLGIHSRSLMLCVDSSPQVASRLVEGRVLSVAFSRFLARVVIIVFAVLIRVRRKFSPSVVVMVLPARSCCVQELGFGICLLVIVGRSGSCRRGAT